MECHTADYLKEGLIRDCEAWYYSIGQRRDLPLLRIRPEVRLKGYWQLEPPCVDPGGYPVSRLVQDFEHVYTHDKFRWPQVRDQMLDDLEGYPRKFLCFINANKHAAGSYFGPELYSERMRAVNALGASVDIYGHGWAGRSNWRGVAADKFEVLKQYDFCLCFENQSMPDYITEKIFECMFCGTIPIYWGAPNIERYVWPECFIDMRQADSYEDLKRYLSTWNQSAKDFARACMRGYLQSEDFRPFTIRSFCQQVLTDSIPGY